MLRPRLCHLNSNIEVHGGVVEESVLVPCVCVVCCVPVVVVEGFGVLIIKLQTSSTALGSGVQIHDESASRQQHN